ncbi:hypothetical protein J4G07_04740 [Candidatus Poribacteria bacterium]|nr:hypothetical protein [Candidatus Poribacteria bacterium]
MTFFIPTKSLGDQEITHHFVDLEKAQRIYASTTATLEESYRQKGSHCIVTEMSPNNKDSSIYSYGSQRECENEIKNLTKKLKRRNKMRHIIAPGVFIFLGLVLGVAISLIPTIIQ